MHVAVSARHRKGSAAGTPPLPRRVLSRTGSLLLTVLSILGLGCIVLVILGLTMNMSLIMFSTGSMAPTIPAGSVALVQEVSGSEIEVGDVVTVERPGKLPVTHRVTEILAVDGDVATFTMQGDANDTPDTDPYTAETVRIVRGHVPGVARVVVAFQNPLTLGAITVGAALLVTWAFWPRKDESA
jgi:signal peptidase